MNINKDNSVKSHIKIHCRRVKKKTILLESYFDIPYKLSHYGNPQRYDHLEIIQMCTSPGLMAGDSLQLEIRCAENTAMKFYTQSYQKVHPALKQKGACQHFDLQLAPEALFCHLPHPTILYAGSIFETTNHLALAAGAHLIWSEIVSGGRVHFGERFLFDKYRSKTKIEYKGKLIFFDNQLIVPKQQPLETLLFFEGYTHQATFLMVGLYAEDFKKELDALLAAQFTDVSYGFTHCAPEAVLLRALGNSGDALHQWFIQLGRMAWDFIRHKKNKK